MLRVVSSSAEVCRRFRADLYVAVGADLVVIDGLFVPCCVLTMILPLAIGYLVTGTAAGDAGRTRLGGNPSCRVQQHHVVGQSICHRSGSVRSVPAIGARTSRGSRW
jgi:hypothetical protein